MQRERAGQRRGVPLLAPVLESLKQIGRYTEAELDAAMIAAMVTVMIERDSPTSSPPFAEEPDRTKNPDGPDDDYGIALAPAAIDDELVVLLQCIREHFGAKVHITSGYRTAAYNATLPGASSNSQHIQGRAADFWVEGVTVNAVADYAEKLLPGRGGIGRYPKDAAHPKRVTGWVHIDTRPNKSRWKM